MERQRQARYTNEWHGCALATRRIVADCIARNDLIMANYEAAVGQRTCMERHGWVEGKYSPLP